MVNFANGASGALTGAATGSVFGAPGAIVGGAIGGALGLFGSSKPKKQKKVKPKKRSTLDPQQQALYNDYISSIRGEGPMKDMYNFDAQGYNNVFDQTVQRPANRNFQENIIPGITGQFRGNNLQNSSYLGQDLSRAGRDVQENLDAQRSQNIFQGQQQANANKQNAINNIMNTQTFAYDRPPDQQQRTPSAIDQILSTAGPAAGQWFADYLTKKTSATSASPIASGGINAY